jgi:hypothetical protein
MTCRERGKNIIFRRGGGNNIVFGLKYTHLIEYARSTLFRMYIGEKTL